MQVFKAVQIPYEPTGAVLSLLETFRNMVNYCIKVGLEKNVSSRFNLQNEVYHHLGEFGLHSWYSLSAVEVATTILKNYRKMKRRRPKVKVPYATKLMAELGNQGYRVVDGRLRIPIKPREYFFISPHKRASRFLTDATLKLGSLTLTPCMVSVAISKEIEVDEPKSYIAYDTNERSIDGARISEDGELSAESYDLSDVSETRHGYFERVRKVQAKYAADRRVAKKIQRRWFTNQNNKVNTILHQTSSTIVKQAISNKQGIILEDLKHIHNSVNRRVLGMNTINGKIQKISRHSKALKRRLNSWSFQRLQGFIEYKALWYGVKVIKANPRNTSKVCAVCGCTMQDPKAKTLDCCGLSRHINACLNLLKIQDETLRFSVDRSARVAVIRPLDKAVSQSGEATPNRLSTEEVTEPALTSYFTSVERGRLSFNG
jgi:putative transposase